MCKHIAKVFLCQNETPFLPGETVSRRSAHNAARSAVVLFPFLPLLFGLNSNGVQTNFSVLERNNACPELIFKINIERFSSHFFLFTRCVLVL